MMGGGRVVRSANTLSVDDNRGWEALITLFASALADTRERECVMYTLSYCFFVF